VFFASICLNETTDIVPEKPPTTSNNSELVLFFISLFDFVNINSNDSSVERLLKGTSENIHFTEEVISDSDLTSCPENVMKFEPVILTKNTFLVK